MKHFFSNLARYIKTNWLFLTIMLLGTLILFLQMRQIVFYADDFSYGLHSDGTIESAFNEFVFHYQNHGGHYIPFVHILLLGMDFIVQQVLFTLLITISVGLATKMLCHNHPKYKWLVAGVLWSCFFLLTIWVSHEAVYWSSGAMNYLVPMFQAFLFFYLFYTRLIQGASHRYDIVLLPVAALFSGWSTAQGGVIAMVIALALIAWQRFIKKTKIPKFFYVCTALTILGFCIYYFAPGNNGRIALGFPEYEQMSFFERLASRAGPTFAAFFNSSNLGPTGVSFYLYLALGLTALLDLTNAKSAKSKRLQALRYCCSAYTLLYIFCFLLAQLGIPTFSPLFSAMFKFTGFSSLSQYGVLGLLLVLLPYFAAVLAVLSSLVSAFFIAKSHKNPFIFTVLLTSFAAALSLILSPYNPIRTSYYPCFCLWLAIAYLLLRAIEDKVDIFPVAIIMLGIFNFNLALVFAIIYLALLSFKHLPAHYINFAFLAILATLSLYNAGKTFLHYYENRLVQEPNIATIQDAAAAYAETGEAPSVIYLQSPCAPDYLFTTLDDDNWIEEAVRAYYHLPNTLDIEYSDSRPEQCLTKI